MSRYALHSSVIYWLGFVRTALTTGFVLCLTALSSQPLDVLSQAGFRRFVKLPLSRGDCPQFLRHGSWLVLQFMFAVLVCRA